MVFGVLLLRFYMRKGYDCLLGDSVPKKYRIVDEYS